jgi:hypothetical protein
MQIRKSFMFLLISLFLVSCDKESSADGGGSGSDSFECSIDGTAHKISGQFAFAQKIATDIFTINGSEDQTKKGFKNVYISLKAEPSVGKYDLGVDKAGSGNILETGTGTLFNSNFPGGSGTLDVTEKTASRIKGTFSFIGADATGIKKNVTNGKFDVKIK